MRKLIISLFTFIFITISLNAQQTYVLAVGVADYQNASKLNYTIADAQKFAKGMEVQTQHVTILTSKYATKENILDKLRLICQVATSEDRIIFFFSGHGGKGFLYTYDGIDQNPYLYYIDLLLELRDSKAKEKICFIDACFSGTLSEAFSDQAIISQTDWSNAISDDKLVFVLSSKAEEVSWEHSWLGKGFFTNALLKALSRKGDMNKDGKITVMEMFRYVHADVRKHTKNKQTPQLVKSKKSDEALQMVIAKWH